MTYENLVAEVEAEAKKRLFTELKAREKVGKWNNVLRILFPNINNDKEFNMFDLIEGKIPIEQALRGIFPQELNDALEQLGIINPSLHDAFVEMMTLRKKTFEREIDNLMSSLKAQVWAERRLAEMRRKMDVSELCIDEISNVHIQKENADREVRKLLNSDILQSRKELFSIIFILIGMINSQGGIPVIKEFIACYVPFQQAVDEQERNLERQQKLLYLKLEIDSLNSISELAQLVESNAKEISRNDWIRLFENSSLSTSLKESMLRLVKRANTE